jgi:hypothetical protein
MSMSWRASSVVFVARSLLLSFPLLSFSHDAILRHDVLLRGWHAAAFRTYGHTQTRDFVKSIIGW